MNKKAWNESDVLRFLAQGIEYVWDNKKKLFIGEDGTTLYVPPYGNDFSLLETKSLKKRSR